MTVHLLLLPDDIQSKLDPKTFVVLSALNLELLLQQNFSLHHATKGTFKGTILFICVKRHQLSPFFATSRPFPWRPLLPPGAVTQDAIPPTI